MSRPRAAFKVKAKVWLYPGAGGWHFVNLPLKHSRTIREMFGAEARGFGSLPILVRIGKTEWRTSLFPARESRAYMFAIKADVRRREGLDVGDTVAALVQIL